MTSHTAARLLLRTRQALLAASFVVTALWAWRHAGLYRMLADVELRITGRYDPFWTLLFTFLMMFVASMAIGAAITSQVRRRFSKEEWQTVLQETTALLDNAWWKRRT